MTDLDQDAETVRNEWRYHHTDYDGPVPQKDEFNAALGRILAELERLHDLNQRKTDALGKYDDLITHLKTRIAELEAHFLWEQDSSIPVCPNEAEIERLRAELTQGFGPLGPNQIPLTPVEAYRLGYKTGADDNVAEVERLRGELELTKGWKTLTTPADLARLHRIEEVLKDLLEDRYYSGHACSDPDCGIRMARAALEED